MTPQKRVHGERGIVGVCLRVFLIIWDGGLHNVMSNYLTLTATACQAGWKRTAGWQKGWIADWLADLLTREVWPAQCKRGKQSTLRGRVLDLCWHKTSAGSWMLVLFSCLAQVEGVEMTYRWQTGVAPPLRHHCVPLLCLLPPRDHHLWEEADVGHNFSGLFRILGVLDIQLQFICSGRLLLPVLFLFSFLSSWNIFSGFMLHAGWTSRILFHIPPSLPHNILLCGSFAHQWILNRDM